MASVSRRLFKDELKDVPVKREIDMQRIKEVRGSQKMSEIHRLKLDLEATKNQIRLLHNSQDAHSLSTTVSPSRVSRVSILESSNFKKDFHMTILFLDEALLLRIFSQLEMVDLVAVSAVCKLFHRLSKTRYLWEGFYSFYSTSYCAESKQKEDEEPEYDLTSEIKAGESADALLSGINGAIQKLTSPFGTLDEEVINNFIDSPLCGSCPPEQLVMKLVKRYSMKSTGCVDRIAFIEQRKMLEEVQKKTLRLIRALFADNRRFSEMTRSAIILIHIFVRGVLDEKSAAEFMQNLHKQTVNRYKNKRLVKKTVSVRSFQVETEEPSFLKVNTGDYARAITLKLARDFRKIKSDDLMGYASGRRTEVIQAIEEHSIHFSRWILTVILECDVHHVVGMVGKMIELAKELRSLHNFQLTAVAVLSLRGQIMSRLKEAFKRQPVKINKMYAELQELTSAESDFKNLRTAIATAKAPYIPYLVLTKQDLHALIVQPNTEKTHRLITKFTDSQRVRYNFPPADIQLKPVTLRFDNELQRMSSRLALAMQPQVLSTSYTSLLDQGQKSPARSLSNSDCSNENSPSLVNSISSPPKASAPSSPANTSPFNVTSPTRSPKKEKTKVSNPLKFFRNGSFFRKKSEQDVTGADSLTASPKTYVINFDEADIDFNEPLGKGGSASGIFRAVLQGFTIAVKWFDIRDCCEEMLDSIKKEIRIMSNIPEHPNIAKYLGHSSQPGKEICIFMSFYMESLHSFIDKKRETQTNFSSEEILELAMQISHGLVFLHTLPRPVAHLDIKSENVFVVKSVKNNKISLSFKIGDFGEAEELSSRNEVISKCNLGTTEFRAPEVFGKCSGKPKGLTTKADVWSFGMLLYELMTLDIPYRNCGMNNNELFDYIEAGNPPKYPENVATLCQEDELFAAIFHIHKQCIEKDVERRPDSTELLSRLQELRVKFPSSAV